MKTIEWRHFVFFVIALTFFSFISANARSQDHKFVVVLDAGHGGNDPGNIGNGFKEKDIALKIVLMVGKELEKNPNIEVIYTREKDVFVDLFVRGKIANKANADLFVSVHCNAHGSSAHGTETFVLGTHRNQTNFEVAKKENSVIFLEDDYEKNYQGFDPNSPESVMSILLSQEEYLDQSILLASLIEKNFSGGLKRKSRGVKQAGFIVLHQTVMPSVLIETGFLTYKSEGTYLNSRKGQSEMSQAIVSAVLQYKNSLNSNIDYSLEDFGDEVTMSDNPNDVVFKVQIAASSKSIDTEPYNFKGLNGISMYKEGNLYKYFYGQTSSYEATKTMIQEAKSKGFSSSFVVPFKAGKKITLSEALKTTAN
ncbi:N-acetylmuramoyl-L-alanine amidase family protein [Aestuariivivens sediminis]|uniref:N-acetylmuramoyl-L-alanine amidase family protein n=1 Tax=Aestuariivivens sediminis TaxID=2913557 RepID=UPI001F5847FC|nr:N-acetylmuramoyl-L-alanine amidase [Aestuariivivens sediminis]